MCCKLSTGLFQVDKLVATCNEHNVQLETNKVYSDINGAPSNDGHNSKDQPSEALLKSAEDAKLCQCINCYNCIDRLQEFESVKIQVTTL